VLGIVWSSYQLAQFWMLRAAGVRAEFVWITARLPWRKANQISGPPYQVQCSVWSQKELPFLVLFRTQFGFDDCFCFCPLALVQGQLVLYRSGVCATSYRQSTAIDQYFPGKLQGLALKVVGNFRSCLSIYSIL
jgi:hypothetical protein